LLVGHHDGPDLVFAGGVGSGFDAATLRRLYATLAALEQPACPFRERPQTLETPHWVRPALVVEVRYGSWTEAGQMRHPVFVGVRDDVRPEDVRREPPAPPPARGPAVEAAASPAPAPVPPPEPAAPHPAAAERAALEVLVARLEEIEASRAAGRLALPDRTVLSVSNLDKVFWPRPRLTKGALLRYYVRVAPYLLPVVADRPLVMQRFPDGIEGNAFYQHRAPPKLARGVRVTALPGDDVPARLVGGSLTTLLYMAQLAVISQDPWFSTVDAPALADQVALDLDPMPDVPFDKVRDVARWLRDELARLDAPMVLKTSGASGLHIFLPLRAPAPYEAGRLFVQIIAAIVARQHPDVATVERVVGARGPKVYIDCLQNIQGKTLACAYSARASAFAGASTPLGWAELEAGALPEDFTIETLPRRLERVGDLWAGVRGARRLDLAAALDRLRRRFPGGAGSPAAR
jgi:bifunctional non-homologous end joining protein LigD